MDVNAVFQGGGVKGIGLVGAVTAAESSGIKFHQVAGTSSGSIVASLIAAGYTAEEMRQTISSTPFSHFLARDWLHRINYAGPALRILLRKGLYSGERLELWVKGLLQAKGIRTFNDLPPGKLRVIASDITQGKLLVLPDDLIHYGIKPGQFEVAKAVRMSCSIPYFFEPVLLRKPLRDKNPMDAFHKQFYYIVDGALLSNFPLWLLDEHHGRMPKLPTLGFQLVGKRTGEPNRINGPFTMLQALFETMLNAHDERYIGKHNDYRTIKIPADIVGTTEFSVSPEKSQALYEAGREAGRIFFDRWSFKQYLETYIDREKEPKGLHKLMV
ncbi:patatin-like phospholipase family protein [Paenibacillus gansuensis]|uniref:Patatin-like phospholipase family protein n=1 Tax=Paenibacillus gansuensis TaxID=306542 RepID=A0ABW5P9I2_9BACL